MAVNTSSPLAPVRSAMASALATSVVPAWTMFLRSLSSEAAASLITALTRAASDTGSFGPESNHTDASPAPPRSRERSRMIADDSSPTPIAALASVLAISIAACSTAWPGRSAEEVPVVMLAPLRRLSRHRGGAGESARDRDRGSRDPAHRPKVPKSVASDMMVALRQRRPYLIGGGLVQCSSLG